MQHYTLLRHAAAWSFMLASASTLASFTPEERAAIVSFWSEPGRLSVALPDTVSTQGPYQVRLTSEGSTWLWNLSRARGRDPKIPGVIDAKDPLEIWLSTKLVYDRWVASEEARILNNQLLNLNLAAPTEPPPPNPGPIPTQYVEVIGNPPPFSAAVTPRRHTITFEDGFALVYNDHVPLAPRSPFFRFEAGVQSVGTQVRLLAPGVVSGLFRAASIDATAERVMLAVSPSEGGFDSVNTYDTGFVSVGFIQFACLSGGSGSLGNVLLLMRQRSPDAFQEHFRRYGIDVTDLAVLNVVDPRTGAEVFGPDAARAIIEDKRLIATFQRAGQRSPEFRIAQILTAKTMYYPADDDLSFAGNGPLLGKISDVFRSEAGLAALMDRKVNTGTLAPILPILSRFARENNVKDIRELAKYEREIVRQIIRDLRVRRDFLSDPTLSQPK